MINVQVDEKTVNQMLEQAINERVDQLAKQMKTNNVVLEEAVRQAILEQEESAKKRNEFVRANTMEWLENGEKLRERRLKHNMSLREVGDLLGTAASRIRRMEVGDPVSMAEHLTTCYNLLFDYIELKKSIVLFSKLIGACDHINENKEIENVLNTIGGITDDKKH